MNREIPTELWLAAPKDARFWAGVHPPDDPADVINECPGHGPGTEDEPDFCDGACVGRPRRNMIDDTEAKAARVDRYEKNLPSWLHGTPEDVDAWIRDLIPDDKRLAFYQWIGALAVKEAVGVLRDNLANDPREGHGQHYHRDDVEEMFELLGTEDSVFPTELPVGRPFCDVDYHTHTHGGGRLPTCRLDSPE